MDTTRFTCVARRPRRRRRTGRLRMTSAVLAVVLTVALTVMATALNPGGAWAAFTGGTTGTMSVGTATLSAPSAMTLTTTCPTVFAAGSVAVTFPDAAAARSYTVSLDQPLTPTVTRTVTSGPTGTTFVLPRNVFGLFTLTVTSKAGTWTSPTTSRTVTCLAL